MSYTDAQKIILLQIANKALGKIGGLGDQQGADPFLADWDSTDSLPSFITTTYEAVKPQVIKDLALRESPFRETTKYADLGTDLKQSDVGISSIAVGADPFPITVTTEEAHGLSTGDTVYLTGIRGTGGIETLNNAVYTITVVLATTFTLDDTAGTAAYSHTADSGTVSLCPEIGGWSYAFDLPSSCIAVVKQLMETFSTTTKSRQKYRFETLLNRDSDGQILVTNNYSNSAGDSAFIQYVINQSDPTVFSEPLKECIATLLAAEISPFVGKDMKTRIDLLTEYQQLNIPEAMKFNQSQVDNRSKPVGNYLGGRSEVPSAPTSSS